jgi:hypothetical protein
MAGQDSPTSSGFFCATHKHPSHYCDHGRSVNYDDELVGAALAGARQWVDDSVRTPQMFGPEVTVPDKAPLMDQLVGFLRRRPDWPTT